MARTSGSALVNEVRGKVGNVVFVKTRSGQGVRRRPQYRMSLSPAQFAATARLRQAAALWLDLSVEEGAAWEQYAETITRSNNVSGTQYSPCAYNAFSMLTTKFLQLNPEEDPPRLPPVGDFIFASPTLEVEGQVEGVLFTALWPCNPGEAMELYIQKLPTQHRKPGNQYVSAAVAPFHPGELEYFLPLEPGYYALAARPVCLATGEMGLFGKLATVTVGP